MTRVLVVSGGVLLAFALFWHVSLGKRWTQRVYPGFSLVYDYSGTQAFAAPGATALPAEDELGGYERRLRLVDERGRPDSVVLEDSYRVRKGDSDTIVFEYVTRDTVDPHTGAHVSHVKAGDILLFPRNVQQRTYVLRSNYLKGIPLAFERAYDIEGLDVYMFSYAGPLEYTEAYAGTPAVPGVPLLKGQEIRCADDGFRYRTWVEPVTGAVVKVEEACPSGSYVYDVASGKKLYPIDRFSGVTSGRALSRRAETVRGLRARYLFASRDFPGGLLLGGFLLLAAAALRARREAA